MFESSSSASRPVFRIDPWMSDYSSSLPFEEEAGADGEGRKGFSIEYDVEDYDWQEGVDPVDVPRPDSFFFVDGVQRIEAWGVVEDGERTFEAAIASIAVGGVVCTRSAAVVDNWSVERVLATSGAVDVPFLYVAMGGREVEFRPTYSTVAGLSPRAAIGDAISRRRRELERHVADRALQDERLVVVDGRLPTPSSSSAIVGLAKTIQERYLDEPHWRLVPKLVAGQRTPVFRIDYDSRTSRYAWFLRLPYTRPISHSLAGIVRLETPEVGEREAVRLANLTARCLPAFASRPEHDPRAPQNLLPVGGLERRLRHEMGDPAFIRRAIEDQLMRQLKEART
jgi:uncharacterized protein